MSLHYILEDFIMFKDFFLKEVDWGYPWKKKATKFSQWYTLAVCMVGIFALSRWATIGVIYLIEKIDNRKHSKIEKEVMEEIETE